MLRLRGFVAAGFVLVTGISAASCGSSDGPASTDGTGGSVGADASTSGGAGGGTSTGGESGGGGGGEGGVSTSLPDASLPANLLHCGDGNLDPGEDCDDGNHKLNDGCENNCRFSCTLDAHCSNGSFCDGPETCGPDHVCQKSAGPLPDGKICGETNTCKAGLCKQAEANCGDTLTIKPTEECDPPDGKGCTKTCLFTCLSTDATRDCRATDPCAAPEACNDSSHLCAATAPAAKDLTACGTGRACVKGACTDKYCSNRQVDTGEKCDDGNRIVGDGCDNDCQFSCDPADTTRDCKQHNECIIDGTCGAAHKCSAFTPKAAGAACGNKQNCLQGNCIAPKCGDGILAAGIETCDDGNAVTGDGCDTDCTPSCVNPLTDCTGTPPCRAAVCTASKCDSAPDASKDGSTCNTGGGAATCHAGACTTGTCGNGTKDTGEQCDDSNLTPGDGCEPNCTFTCTLDSQCADTDTCNGAETCDTGSHQCKNPTNLADGANCAGGKICLGGSCRPSLCGDGFVKTGTEECDPPNTAGCDATCKARAICNLNGQWAMKVTVPVTWGDDSGVIASSTRLATENPGYDTVIRQWMRLNITQTNTTFTATLRPCGLTIPDFQTTVTLGSEWYGISFPNDVYDSSPKIPQFQMTGTVSSQLIGASFETSALAILLGMDFGTPVTAITDPWPADLTGLTILDQDNDASPGMTAKVKVGPVPGLAVADSFKNIIVDVSGGLANPLRGDKLFLVIRQVASQTGTVDSCNTISGTTDVTKIDNHIVGCQVDSGSTCSAAQSGLSDAVRPIYAVDPAKGATFVAEKMTGASTSCDTVRGTLP